MDAWIHGGRIRLSDADLLGEGGEARVYRYGKQAVKLFHTPSKSKAKKLLEFPAGLPPEVIAPSALVHDKAGAVIGYAMNAVLGHEELARLSSRKWREGAVPAARVLELFEQLRAALGRLHAMSVVVGDLNDGNVLFDQTVKLIDADSMQFAGLPCEVGHERTLAPELYGADLTAACRFTAATDWYAWNVLLFSSLLYLHPYGGVHPKLPTLLRRAEARHSVLEPDVTYPKSALHWRVLPDDVLHHFSRVFGAAGERTPAVPPMQWARCSCGLEHARAACPDCQTRGPAAARQALRSSGRCSARSIFTTSGRVLEVALEGGVRWLYEENGVVRREDGSLVLDQPAAPGARFAISGASTWVADRSGGLIRVLGGKTVERASTGVLRGMVPVVTPRYRLEQEWIVEHSTGARVGQILEGQTWLWSGARLGLALYRAGDATHVFLLRAGQPGLLPVRHVPGGRGAVVSLQGRVIDATCVFDDGHALLTVSQEHGGRDSSESWLFNAAGQLLARGEAKGRSSLLGGRVVCATDRGLLAMKVDSQVLVEGTLFTDTEPFVSATDELYAQPDGSLVVAGPKEIIQLSLQP